MYSTTLAIRILLFPVWGYEVDLGCFSAWFKTAAEHGPRIFYEAVSWCDYPPFNVYIFWIFGLVAKWLSLFGTKSLVYILKLPSNLFDIAIAFLIFIFLRRRFDLKSSVMITSLYAFNPATIFNGSVWGQFDAVYTFFLILSLMLMMDFRPELSAMALTIGFLIKPQSIALFPLIVFLILKLNGWRRVFTSTLVSAAVTLLIILPFKWSDPVDFLVRIYLEGYGGYPYNSVNAFNVWALMGFWKSDTQPFLFLNFYILGWIMFGGLTAFLLYNLSKRLNGLQESQVIFFAFLLFFGFFMLPTRIHERYLFPVFSVLSLTIAFLREAKWIYGALTFTYLFNQAYVLAFLNRDAYIPDGDPYVYTIILVNLIAFFYSIFLAVKKGGVRR